MFGYLGTFVARSLLDNRIFDFRFSRVFFELMHRMCTPQCVNGIKLRRKISINGEGAEMENCNANRYPAVAPCPGLSDTA